MNRDKNWEGFTNIGHANWTGITPSKSSGYAPGTDSPPCGWCVALLLGVVLCALFLFGPTMALRWLS